MNFALQRISAPTSPIVNLAEMKAHLRVDFADDDALIAALTAAATERAENVTGRSLAQQQWQLTMDGFPGERRMWCEPRPLLAHHPLDHLTIRLPRNPVVSVDAISYVDPFGAMQTIDPSTCQIDLQSEPSRLRPAFGTCWPATRRVMNAVTIQFTTGYATESDVPSTILQAIKLMVGAWYESRADFTVGEGMAQTLPRAAEYILGMHRLNRFGFTPYDEAGTLHRS